MQSQTVNISLPQPLLRQIDFLAGQEYATRSDYIRQAVIEKINSAKQWQNIFLYGKKMGKKVGVKSEEDVYRIIEEYRREKHASTNSS